jgi:uncharacterized membrane protein YesL
MNYSGFMGGLFALTEWIMRFSIINILWIINNLPILLIIGLMYFSQTTATIDILAVPLALLMPVLFFPSITSVFANVRDWILDKEQPSLIKSYWIHLKGNYKKSFLSGLALTLIWAIWVIDFYYFRKVSDILVPVMLVIGISLIVYTINFINLNVHFLMSYKELFRNAFYLTVGKPLLFFFILISNLLLFYVSLTKVWFLIPFFTISMSSFLSFYAFYRLTLKVEEKVINGKDKQ